MKKVIFKDLGIIEFEDAWQIQEELLKEKIAIKIQNRRLIELGEKPNLQTHHLLFCEHHPVYTLGKSGTINHLLLNEQDIKTQGFKFFKINRGGDITYHGPGQIVGYPIVKLRDSLDVVGFVRELESSLIEVCKEFGLLAERYCERSGVWIRDSKGDRKIAAIGIRVAKGVTMHGFALNIDPDLSFYEKIVPCGIADAGVTSFANELGQSPAIEDVLPVLERHIYEALAKVSL